MFRLQSLMNASILALNPGSSTLKFGLYRRMDGVEHCWAGGLVDRLGTAQATLRLEAEGTSLPPEPLSASTPAQATEAVLARLDSLGGGPVSLAAIGCRVVHGGAQFLEPTRATPQALTAIRRLSPLAPLHNPLSADVLETCLRLRSRVPAVAVFDTAFHRTLPEVARLYALPHDLCEQYGLRRYGFHGIAHHYVSERLRACLADAPSRRGITCHLGSGASLCALLDGRSVDTSMGLTPMEGLVMGTRAGDVDPGLILYLLQSLGKTPEEVDRLLNRQSGLLGLSGLSADLRDLERAAQAGDPRAELAQEVFAYRVAKTIGAYAVALEGLDALAFSGGIGEHSASMRQRICRRLGFLGLALEAARNAEAVGGETRPIHATESQVAVWVIPADEGRQIAQETRDVVFSSPDAFIATNTGYEA